MGEKTVLITGASRGIGAACAKRFAKDGCSLLINYCSSDGNAKAVAEDCLSLGAGQVSLSKADVSKSKDIDRLFENAGKLGFIDTLVLNAGVASYGLFQDVSEEEYDRIMDTNVKGVFLTAKKFIPKMISEHRGSIVIISSMWGQVGGSCEVVYSASKAALIGMTKALAKELGPSGIRVNCVAPGVIDTDMIQVLGQETLDVLRAEMPMRRFGRAEEIAETILHLARATYTTGQVFTVDGGFII